MNEQDPELRKREMPIQSTAPREERIRVNPPLSDEALMVRLMEGEAAAFDLLYQRYAPRIRTFVYRFIGNRESAEDVTQEIFLKVYRNPRAFDPRKRFLTWIFAVARNASIDHLRLKKLPTVPLGGRESEDSRAPQVEDPSPSVPLEQAMGQEL